MILTKETKEISELLLEGHIFEQDIEPFLNDDTAQIAIGESKGENCLNHAAIWALTAEGFSYALSLAKHILIYVTVGENVTTEEVNNTIGIIFEYINPKLECSKTFGINVDASYKNKARVMIVVTKWICEYR